MKFLGLGVPELLIILVVVLLIFGPKNLPKLGSAIGKSVKGLREGMASDEGKVDVELDDEEEETKKTSEVVVEHVEDAPKKKVKVTAKKTTNEAEVVE